MRVGWVSEALIKSDQVCVFEAPDDETAAAVLLAADMLGNIRTQTLRAFTASEMEKILARVP
jgi:uncharacterized protein with GYD domain